MSIKYVHACRSSRSCHEKNHICQIILDRDLGRIKDLVRESRYYCKNCGRAAHKKENLCNPSKI
ncbi:MAG: hypothetical protein GF408_06265 [Candidatus Omnitrophica bacterium]|nr:hypothetical protein [Candidatus Omnitrophota bacterium]